MQRFIRMDKHENACEIYVLENRKIRYGGRRKYYNNTKGILQIKSWKLFLLYLIKHHENMACRTVGVKLNIYLKNAVFWDVTPCDSCKNQSFGGTYRLHHQGDKNRRARNNVSSILQPKHATKKYCSFAERV
jgi:hypothetical protein